MQLRLLTTALMIVAGLGAGSGISADYQNGSLVVTVSGLDPDGVADAVAGFPVPVRSAP